MSKLPAIKPRFAIRALKKAGYKIDHQTGSYVILEKPGHPSIITVPMHNIDLKKGTLKAILKQAGLSNDDFLNLI
ncbi:MAG: addiction module toxin, HicA family [Chitinivibrionales bacterium]|nr:addiction module toxin, HicA family [Chitinivibrionales bacterium]